MVEERRFAESTNSKPPPETSGKIVFLNVSMLKDGKGHSELLKAFSAAFSGREDIMLRIGGDGDKRSELEELCISLGVSGQVSFLGKLNRDQVFQEMRAANIVVLPSHFETFGVVLIEALASGTPIIATKCNGPECICTPENGLLVSPRDVDELSEAMRVMAIQYQKYGKRKLVEECREKYGEKNIVRKLINIYKDVLQAKNYCSVEKETDTLLS